MSTITSPLEIPATLLDPSEDNGMQVAAGEFQIHEETYERAARLGEAIQELGEEFWVELPGSGHEVTIEEKESFFVRSGGENDTYWQMTGNVQPKGSGRRRVKDLHLLSFADVRRIGGVQAMGKGVSIDGRDGDGRIFHALPSHFDEFKFAKNALGAMERAASQEGILTPGEAAVIAR